MESGSVAILRRRDENHVEDIRPDNNTLRENRATTEVRLVHDWTDSGGERKRSKEEKVFLMTSVRDLRTKERAAVACAKRRDALCFVFDL